MTKNELIDILACEDADWLADMVIGGQATEVMGYVVARYEPMTQDELEAEFCDRYPESCAKCGESFCVHNDDGSCVDDELESEYCEALSAGLFT